MEDSVRPAQVVVDFIIDVMSRLPDELEDTSGALQRCMNIEQSRLEGLRDLYARLGDQVLDIEKVSLVELRKRYRVMGRHITEMERARSYTQKVVESMLDASMRASVIRPLVKHFHSWTDEIERELEPFNHRAVLNGLPVGIFMTAQDGRILDINEPGLRLWRYKKEEVLSKNIRDLYARPEERAGLIGTLNVEGAIITSVDTVCGDGEVRTFDASAKLFNQEGLTTYLVVFTEHIP